MTHEEIIKKLIGPISPIGKTEVDDERFENLKQMCELVDGLLNLIESVNYHNSDAREFSVKRAADYAKNFIKDIKQ